MSGILDLELRVVNRRYRLCLCLGLAWLGTIGMACATGGAPSGPGVEIRPDAPPEYDVLVFHDHIANGRVDEAIVALERAVAKDGQSPYLHRLLAEFLARSSQIEEAVAHARRAHELAPDDPEMRSFLAQLYRIQQDVDAIEALLRDEDGAPRDLDSAFLLYQTYADAGDLDAAVETARWITGEAPEELRGWIALASAYERLGKPIESEAALRRSLEVDPDNLRVYGHLARSMRQRGDSEGAIEVYRQMLERQPDDHATLVGLAEAQVGEEDLEGAIETFEQIAERFPADLQSLTRLGFLLYEARRYDDAIARLEQVLEASPREHEVAFFLGLALRRTNRDDAAVEHFERIPAHDDYYAEARTQLAAIHERRGRYGDALAEVQRAIGAEPSRDLELYAATLRSKTGDFDGAVAYLEGLLDESADDDELLYNLGVVYSEADRDDEAVRYMERALEHNPDNADALNFIGYTWAERGENLEQAEEYIVRALELRPENGYIVDSLGWVYYMRGRPLIEAGDLASGRRWVEKALEELERADELTGGDPVISEHMGDAYLLLERRRQALDKFEEAALMGPRPDEQPKLHEKLETLRRELE